MQTAREIRLERIFSQIEENKAALMAEYSKNTICIPDSDKWDYAIPEMYLNYQDGFLFPKCEAYKAMPLFILPDSTVLYLRWEVSYFNLMDSEREKYLCFDRSGNKYTIIIQETPQYETGNPSYFRFLPRVKRYTPNHAPKRR